MNSEPQSPLPVDQAARQRISRELAATLFVEAGAGTGKTTELVHRIVRLVATGAAGIEHIAAITFTEAAAAELRERVREALEHAVRDPRGLDEEERTRCRLALQRVDEAPIQTLHGFAFRLLAQHAVEAQLPPGFRLADQAEMAVGFERSWNRFLHQLLQDPNLHRTLTLALKLGLRLDNLKVLAQQLRGQWDLVAKPPDEPAPLGAADLSPLLDAADDLLARRSSCPFADDLLAQFLDGRLRAWADGLRHVDAGDEAQLYISLLGLPSHGNKGRASNWTGFSSKDDVLAAYRQVVAARDAIVQRLTEHVMDTLFAALVRFTLREAETRRETGELEFHDLLVRARRLLASGDIRRQVRSRYTHLLIDEFQDTDPLQVDLAASLASPDHGPQPHDLTATESGRLFLVGDPKQSIYRFRRADIEVYGRARHQLGTEPTRLTVNFRSRPRILRFANDAFGPGGGADLGVEWQNLDVHRAGDEQNSTVALLGGPRPGGRDGLTAGEVTAEMAADLVAAIRLVKAQQWPVGEKQPGGETTRPARYDDIAVLLRTRAALGALERALSEAGIPYRIESRSLAWSTQEVRDLLAVLAAIDDPGNEVAAVAALSSVVLGCSLVDLQEWKRAGGTWQAGDPAPPGFLASHPVAEAMADLRRWAAGRHRTTVPALLERILRERRVMEAAYAHPQRRQSQSRYRFVVEHARAWVSGGGVTLGGFLHHVRSTDAAEGAVHETVVPDTDDEAVRITTIHAAKGLEYPVVVVAGLGTRPHYGEAADILWRDGRPYMRCGPLAAKGAALTFMSAGYRDVEEEELVHDQQELARLLYVACTRARDHLIVGLHHQETKAGASPRSVPPAARLHQWTANIDVDARTVEELAARRAGASPDTDEGDGATADSHVPRGNLAVASRGQVPHARWPQDPESASIDAAERDGARVASDGDSGELAPWADDAERAREALALARVGWVQALAAARRPLVVAATAVGALEDPDARMLPGMWGVGFEAPDDEADTLDPGPGGQASLPEAAEDADPGATPLAVRGREFGSAVHQVLEEAELRPDWPGLAASSARAAAAFGADPQRVEQAALSALRTVTVRSAGQAVETYREVYVAAAIEGVTIEGFVDLVYDDGVGLVIVDWKTDVLAGQEAMVHAVEHHSPQLAAYALALEQVTGRVVRRAVLVFCGNRKEANEFIVRDLAGYKAAVRRRLRHSGLAGVGEDR